MCEENHESVQYVESSSQACFQNNRLSVTACRLSNTSFTTITTRAISDLLLVDDHPQGYPQLAAFLNSDENFLIARKYGYLRSRVLLYRQDELSVLEKDLVALDDDDKEKRAIALQSRKYDEQTDKDPTYSRKVLIQKIDDKLKEYGTNSWPSFKLVPCKRLTFPTDELISRIQTYVSLKAPTSRNIKSLFAWIRAYKPLTIEERTFLEHQDDFVALSDEQECGWLDGLTEDTLNACLPANLMKVHSFLPLILIN